MDERTEKYLKKQTRLQRTQVVLTIVILLIVLAAAVSLLSGFKAIRSTVELTGEKLAALDVDGANQAIRAMSDAASELEGLDLSSLNESLDTFQTAAEKLGELDIEKINSLVTALDNTAQKLETAANSISGLFNWR